MKKTDNNQPPPLPHKGWFHRHWKIVLFGALAVGFFALLNPFVIRQYIIQAYKIPAGSMKPTLLIGDHILVDKSASAEDVKRGDVIVFRYPEDIRKDFVKRVVGMPGDRITIQNQQLIINDEKADENYTLFTNNGFPGAIKGRDDFGPITVPRNAFFVLGDNRNNSHDSRFWGCVDFKEFKGIVTTIYWSWDRKNHRVRWERIGTAVE